MDALKRAIELAGGVKPLAAKLGCRDTVIYNWLARDGVPKDQGPAVERATGVPCEELCPGQVWIRVKDARWVWHRKGKPYPDLAPTRKRAAAANDRSASSEKAAA